MCPDAMGEPAEEANQNHEDDIDDEIPNEEISEPRKCEVISMCHDGNQVNGYRGEGGIPGGHDSGVEVAAGEYASSGALDPLSRASSLISCGSGCDDSFDILSCKNADRLDDYKNGAAGDGTSEGGSESSSVTGGNSARSGLATSRKPTTGVKKRVAVNDPGRATRPKPTPAPRPTQGRAPNLATRERARSRDKSASMEKPPPPGPKPTIVPRSRLRNIPDSLNLNCREPPIFKVKATKTSTARCRTPGTPPEEPRNVKIPGPSPGVTTPRAPPLESPFGNRTRMTLDSKAAFDKYATLPRRKRENSPDLTSLRREARSTSANRDTSMNRSMTGLRRSVARDRDSPPLRSLPPYPKHKSSGRIRIYHEVSMQTVLVGNDVENALSGIGISEVRTDLIPVERVDKGIQVDNRDAEIERLEQRVRLLLEANANLQMHSDMQTEKLELAEARLEEERSEKMAAQQELQRNTERVLGMLGGGGGLGSGEGADSLMMLESQLQTSANIVTKQQDEINKLHSACREMQKELDSSHRAQRTLELHLREAEREAGEMQDFLQAEKGALAEALHDTEGALSRAEAERARARQDCRATLRLAEQRRQEALALRARLATHARPPPGVSHRSRLNQQPPALPGLAQGLTTLLNALIAEHCISPEELEDVIFHNEAFSHSASSEGCSPASPPPLQPLPPPVNTKLTCQLSEDENSADLLDSETEPCLMMENVLEDVQIPDTYSHNLVSSGHSVVSCPPGVIGHTTTNADPILLQQNENRFLNIFNKEDSCSSLQNLTTFSGDELSPVIPDEKFCPEMSYPNVDYSENDSLHNLSQAILQRQRSEAECSMSEDYTGHRDSEASAKPTNYLVDQVILVDNLVNKLLKVLKIIHSKEGQVELLHSQTVEQQTSEEMIVNDIASKMAQLCVSNLPHDAINENDMEPDIHQEVDAISNGAPTFITGFFTKFFHKS